MVTAHQTSDTKHLKGLSTIAKNLQQLSVASSLQEELTAEECKRFHDDNSPPGSPATMTAGSKIKSYQASVRKEAAMSCSERYADSENEEPNANDYPSQHENIADVTA